MAEVLCCGGLRVDYLITARGEPHLGEMGGNALYAACGARLWSESVGVLARAGANYPAAWLATLAARGFDVRGVRRLPYACDHRTFYAYLDDNTRDDTNPDAHFARWGLPLPEALQGYVHSTPGQDDPHHYEPLAVRPEDLEHYLAVAELVPHVLHIAPISIRTQQHLPKAARAAGIALISVDPGERAMRPALRSFVEEVLAEADAFLPSWQEVQTFFGANPPGDVLRCARWFAERGPRLVVIKLGSAGAVAYDHRHKRAWQLPAVPTTVVDVTGAGDAFCGGFAAALARDDDVLQAAICGAVSASFAVEGYSPLAVLRASAAEKQHRQRWLVENARALS
ncbi:MAG: carbohydrate kinase family protein [Thermoflexales bacterium]|nr:carbohydrate kinase family protein [Thermoflexales bacterium]MCX7938461.1 carbohydrate kinase family protein [Thermoflexales bacterium]MDW8292528.1 carbohydrate kinase family protein [Anaerolineae bacterium]